MVLPHSVSLALGAAAPAREVALQIFLAPLEYGSTAVLRFQDATAKRPKNCQELTRSLFGVSVVVLIAFVCRIVSDVPHPHTKNMVTRCVRLWALGTFTTQLLELTDACLGSVGNFNTTFRPRQYNNM
jgi:hypothetical protein